MATASKKTATKSAKPAATKSDTKSAATTATTTRSSSETKKASSVDTATVKVGTRTGYHDLSVNGKKRRIRIGEEISVNAAELEALNNSGLDVSVIEPIKGQDAPEAGATTVGGTAIRGEDADMRGSAEPQEPAELRQVTDEQLKNASQAEAAKAAGLDPTDKTATA